MSLIEELDSSDDHVRLRATRRAGDEGGAELVGRLLDLALHDPTEVRTTGGIAEVYEHVGSAAASGLRRILDRQDGLDERIRAAAFDLTEDDERVGTLLYYLGGRYEPVRRELADSGEERLRLRALKAMLSLHRTGELTRRGLADPSPAVRVEAIEGAKGVTLAELERMLSDPAPPVRLAAAQSLRYAADSVAYVVAACAETEPKVREAFLPGLIWRRRTDAVQAALVGYLAADGYVQRTAAGALAHADDPGVAAAIATRILVHPDERDLPELVAYEHLLRHVPELRAPLEHLHRHTPSDPLRRSLTQALAAGAAAYPGADPADGLDAAQRARLLREALRWALAALESAGAAPGDDGAEDPLGGLRAWLAAPDDDTADRWVTELDWFGAGVAAECLHAAVSGDLPRALTAGIRAARQAARSDPAPGWERLGPAADEDRAAELTRLVHLGTARQIRAGVHPLPPGPLSPLLRHGPDALRVGTHFPRPSPALQLRRPLALRFSWPPVSAVLQVPCPGCGVPLRVAGPVQWRYHDDDRVAESEDGYAGELAGECAACGAAGRARIRLSMTHGRFDDSHELTWDAVEVLGGRHE
ncbi:hypothetical protein GCM10020358_12330 [Amorphoplanes nipponensis]|uniref:HEAT repeat domain-containing protein n=1 Tax=Actinoplanes nipponensis TaxID=135950 RepID=A0A919JK34_9ACTN|nr:hypothetical protein [Actinoplanes nipponensis]GIE50730.1 hypothetical protein Ani05nite_42640 [Actinoplanes nipponensis]